MNAYPTHPLTPNPLTERLTQPHRWVAVLKPYFKHVFYMPEFGTKIVADNGGERALILSPSEEVRDRYRLWNLRVQYRSSSASKDFKVGCLQDLLAIALREL